MPNVAPASTQTMMSALTSDLPTWTASLSPASADSASS